ATTKRVNQQRPSSVSHNHDSGWQPRRAIACWRRCTLLLEKPVLRAMRRTLCVPFSQRQLKTRRLLAQNVMSVSTLKGDWTLAGIQPLSVLDRRPIVPPCADTPGRNYGDIIKPGFQQRFWWIRQSIS